MGILAAILLEQHYQILQLNKNCQCIHIINSNLYHLVKEILHYPLPPKKILKKRMAVGYFSSHTLPMLRLHS